MYTNLGVFFCSGIQPDNPTLKKLDLALACPVKLRIDRFFLVSSSFGHLEWPIVMILF